MFHVALDMLQGPVCRTHTEVDTTMSKTVDLDYTLKHFKDTFEEFPGIDNSGLDDSFSRYYQTAALLSIAEDL